MKLVSAIMPTRGRPEFAAKALECFMAQSYPHRELIILDDADDPSFSTAIHQVNGVQYRRQHARLTIAAKLNMACDMAAGEILCRFDDDDWSSPERMADQVKRLEESGKGCVGYHSMLFYVEPSGPSLKYVHPDPVSALGTSLAFTKEWWSSHPFRQGEHVWGEDNLFVAVAREAGQFISVDAGQRMVARAHSGNTSVKDVSKYEYRAVPMDAIPSGFFR